MKRAAAVAVALAILSVAARGQAPAPPSAAPPRDLLLETLPTDIQTADYYELVAWCRSLGVAETGSRADLQARLYAYYKVTAPPEPAKPIRLIIVESARSTDYFRIDSIKEDYLILQGDVRVEFRDSQAGVSHRVSADRLVVNQTRRTLSASGGVTYELARKTGAPEVFKGENFTFDLSDWAGLIVDGRGQSERSMEEGKPIITFFYRGSSIVRRANETVILHDGSVTSSVAEDPYWQIAASRIWVLGPGEWAIQNAVLEVGRIPLFYLPFFYKPGDQLVVHPAIGYRSREGSFIQTTTYLIGAAEEKPSTLSFLQITGDEGAYDTQVEGVFLHKVKKGAEGQPGPAAAAAAQASGAAKSPADAAKSGEPIKSGEPAQSGEPAKSGEQDVFKILGDYYSRLGWFTGVLLKLHPGWALKGGLGFTRTLFATGGVYSPYASGSSESDWNSVQFAGLTLPFRYGLENDVSVTGSPGSLQASISLFSDPFFPVDFYNRAERIDWTGLMSGPQSTQSAIKPGDLDPTQRDNLSWTVTGRYKASPAPPWLDTFEIPRVDFALYWQGRDNLTTETAEDPARRFFAPTRVVAPDLRMRLAGKLLSTPRPGAAAAAPAPAATGGAAAAAPGPAAPPGPAAAGEPQPRINQPVEPEEPAPQASELRPPAPLPDLPGMSIAYTPAYFELGYSIEPRFFFEGQFNQQRWTTPASVDFSFLYSDIEISGAQKVQSLARLWDERLEIKTAINVDGVYRTRFNRAADLSQAEWDSLRLKDYQANRLSIGPSLDLAMLPLADRRSLAASRLTYGLAWDLYNLQYTQMALDDPVYSARLFAWNDTTVKRHELAGRLAYQPGIVVDFVEAKADLPPRDGYYRAEADFTVGISHTNVKGGYRETAAGWQYDVLETTETLDPAPWTQLVARFETDLNDQELDRNDNTLRLIRLASASGGWLFEQRVVLNTRPQPVSLAQTSLSAFGLTARYLAELRGPVEWNGASGSFVATGAQARLVPAEASLSYKAPTDPIFLWHNRIRLVPLVSSSLLFDLYRFTNSRLEVTAGLKASIYRFIDLDFSVTSYNNKLYRYILPWANTVGEPWVNPLEDLVRSYSFMRDDERQLSAFKLRSVSVKATHDLGDWDVSLEYSGSQKLTPKDGGGDEYIWTPVFSLIIEWKPIPQIRREVRQDIETGLTVRG